MIVGMLVIAGGAVFFYATREIKEPIKTDIRIIQEQVPIEFDPIKSYANDCAYSVALEGLKIIGKQGGYISFTNRTLNSEQFTATQNPTESDFVAFTRNSDLKIPYWWYLKSSNSCEGDCKFASKRPDLRQSGNSIERQLERYVNLKFKDCLNGFEPFAEQGFKVAERGKVNSDVTIAAEDVLVLVEYPITVERQGSSSEFNQFIARAPVNLERVYELATKITNMQIKHRFLEKHVINLIAAFSGVSKEKLPPMAEMQFKLGSPVSWQKSEVRDKITAMLASYIPLFQVDGTYNYDRNIFDSELRQRLYDSTILPAANSSFSSLAASFTYLDFWPAYFELNCKGERCAPGSANAVLPLPLGIQTYRFNYDISFPVLVEIQDPFALNEQGYSFNFFLEGNVRNNRQMDASFEQLEVLPAGGSQLCDIRTSGSIEVKASDAATKQPLSDAQVFYTIADESCLIGATFQDGTLTERFPVGVGGVANIVKSGYVGKAIELDTELDADALVSAELQPVYSKKVIIRKKSMVKTPQGWQFADSAIDLDEKESATVIMTRTGEENELDFSSAATYSKEPADIEIAPGNYEADISLMLNERIVIPESEKCAGIFPIRKCETIPKIDFGERATPGEERFPEGGLKLNITIGADELMNSNAIVLYAVAIDIANVPEQDRVIEDIEQISRIEEYSNSYKDALQPAYEP